MVLLKTFSLLADRGLEKELSMFLGDFYCNRDETGTLVSWKSSSISASTWELLKYVEDATLCLGQSPDLSAIEIDYLALDEQMLAIVFFLLGVLYKDIDWGVALAFLLTLLFWVTYEVELTD